MLQKNKNLIFIIVITFMLSGLWLASAESPVQAAASVRAASLGETDEAGACFSLDVVFIIDQSGSMDGSPGVLPNDPTEQRAYGPRWAIDWLTDNALDICPDAIHRVALISFGENAYLDLPLSNVDPNNSQEATRIRERLKENITPQDLGETNPTAAFKLAKDVLDDAAPIGESPRKRVIIYITDGHPCVRALGCTPPNSTMDFVEYARQMKLQVARDFPFDATLLQQESCLNEAIITYGVDFIPPEVSTQCLAEYRSEPESFKNSTYIWTILLKHGEAYSSRLRDQYVEMSESHAGEVVNLTANRGDIPDTFLKIMSRLAGVKAQRLSCGNFAVNPYLRQMRLVFFKVDADNVVSLSYVDAQNNTHQLENGIGDSGFVIAEHGQEGANERYVLDTPYPGIWHFDSDDCNGINAYYEPIEISVGGLQKPLELLAPDGNSYYLDASYGDPPQILVPKSVDPERISDSAKFNLQYTIRDTNGMTISQAGPVIFAINFDVQVTDPKGDQESYEMEWLPDLQLFQSTSILKLPYQGEYQVSVTGTSVNREFPYGPIESRQASQEIYNSTRELFTYSDKFMVTCPDLYTVDRYPWPEDVWQDDDGCDVLPIRNYGFKITAPVANEDLGPVHTTIASGWPLKVRPIDFEITMVDSSGNPLDPSDVVSNASQPFKVTLKSADQLIQVSYQQDPTNRAAYIGTIENFEGAGNMELIVELNCTDAEFYEPSLVSAQQAFHRQDNPWTTRSTYMWLLLLMIVLFILFILYQMAIRNNKVNGTLVFRTGNTVIRSFALGGGKNWKDISTKELKRHPELDLARLRVASRSQKGGKRKVQREEEGMASMSSVSTSGLNLDHPGVVASGRTRSRRGFSLRLMPRVGQEYSSDTEATMEYYPPGEYDGD